MGGVASFLLSPVMALAGVLNKPKAPKPVAPQPVAQTRPVSAVLDAVSARQGSLANRRTRSLGVEPGGGKKTSLGG